MPVQIDILKPHFHIVKLGFTGVYIIFLFLLKNIDCGYSLEPPRRGGSKRTHNLCLEQKYEKYQNFLSEKFHFLVVKFSVYLNRCSPFVNVFHSSVLSKHFKTCAFNTKINFDIFTIFQILNIAVSSQNLYYK